MKRRNIFAVLMAAFFALAFYSSPSEAQFSTPVSTFTLSNLCATPTTANTCSSSSVKIFSLAGYASWSVEIGTTHGTVLSWYVSNSGTTWSPTTAAALSSSSLTPINSTSTPGKYEGTTGASQYLAIVETTVGTGSVTITSYFGNTQSEMSTLLGGGSGGGGGTYTAPPLQNVHNDGSFVSPGPTDSAGNPYVHVTSAPTPIPTFPPSIESDFSITAASGVWPSTPLNVAGYNGCQLYIKLNGGGATVIVNSSSDAAQDLLPNSTFGSSGSIAVNPATQYPGSVAGMTGLQLTYASNTGTLSGSITCTIGGAELNGNTPAPVVLAPGTSISATVNVPSPAATCGAVGVVCTSFGATAQPVNVQGTPMVQGPVAVGSVPGSYNPFISACQQFSTGTNGFTGTAHGIAVPDCDLGGITFVRPGSSHPFSCVVTLTTTTSTQCAGAATGTFVYYITDVSIATGSTQSSTSTTTIEVAQSTGCATTNTAISVPYNTGPSLNIGDHFQLPLFNNTALSYVCVKATGSTVSETVVVNGFLAL